MVSTVLELDRSPTRVSPSYAKVPSFDTSKVKVGAKILIVDDEPDIVKSLSRRLQYCGYEVATASDGQEATRVAFQMKPHVVILDIGMPCGDGHVVAERLKCNASTMLSQIIFLTARTSDFDRQKAMFGGAFGFLTKPFKSEELLQMIWEALAEDNFQF